MRAALRAEQLLISPIHYGPEPRIQEIERKAIMTKIIARIKDQLVIIKEKIRDYDVMVLDNKLFNLFQRSKRGK